MDPEVQRQLEEVHALVKDNHRMLRAMRREAWLGLLGRVIVWAAVLAVSAYAYQSYLAPYVNLLPSFAQLQKLVHSAQAAP